METRKLIQFGKSSLVLSLPKNWTEKNKLQKGDSVYIKEKNNDIIVCPKLKEIVEEHRHTVINTSNKNLESITRELNVAYINSSHTITIKGNNIKPLAKAIREKIQKLMALEIIEQTANKIITKDFLNVNDVSIKSITRKIDIIIRDMIADTKKCPKEEEMVNNILHRDNDVNRLSILVLRLVRFSLNNPGIQKKMEVKVEDLLNYWVIATSLEKVGDQTKRIARLLYQLKPTKKDEEIIINVFTEIEKLYLETMKLYHTKNVEQAFLQADKKQELLKKCDELAQQYKKNDIIATIVEKMKNAITVIHQIGRLVYT